MKPGTSPASGLRVMHCITRFGLGGSERVALSIIRGFGAEFASAVYAVHGVAADPVGTDMRDEIESQGVPWYAGTRLPMKLGGMIPGGFALRRAVREFQPHILHLHSETPEACGAAMLALFPRHRRVALVRTIHNSVFWRYWPRIGRWCDRRLAHAHIACVSTAARGEFLRYRADSGAAAPPGDPVIVHNGVDLAPRQPRPAAPTDTARRILFAGRFEWQKGADLVPEVLRRVQAPSGVALELVLLGHGAHEPELRALAAQPPAGWRIVLRPPVPRLTELLPEFDVLLMPSRFEGLALTAIEATLSGIPVVATDAPGLRETLPAEHPWLAAPGDAGSIAAALQAALRRPEAWEEAVKAAQQFVLSRFTPAAMLAGYREIYRAAAGSPVAVGANNSARAGNTA